MDISTNYAALYRNKTVLITGAAGYLGTALLRSFRDFPCRLLLLGRVQQLSHEIGSGQAEVVWKSGNVVSPETWRDILEGVDIIFHLAAYEHKHGSIHNPTLDVGVNAGSVLYLLEMCREMNLTPRIVFASSSNVTGTPATLPVDESFPDDPLTIYAIHKITAERYLRHYMREFHIPSIILRLPNIFGPVPDLEIAGRVVLNHIIQKALRGETLILFKNHACLRDYLYIDDMVDAFLACGTELVEARGQYYVIGSGEGHSIAEVVNLVAERVAFRIGYKPVIQVNEDIKIEAVEWRNFVANYRHFQEKTGWQPHISLVEGMDRTIDAFISGGFTR